MSGLVQSAATIRFQEIQSNSFIRNSILHKLLLSIAILVVLLIGDINTVFSQNVGVGEPNPQERLHVNGAIIIGTHALATPLNGTIRWSGTDFEGYMGGTWRSLSLTGLSTVTTDATLDGDGTGGNPLRIAQQGATTG
jgi:hypothetical protein